MVVLIGGVGLGGRTVVRKGAYAAGSEMEDSVEDG